MGLFRLILALSVVLGHTSYQGPKLMAAHDAVHIFFVISGFYMCMVIRRKYGFDAKGLRTFYFNRFLRLYPTFIFTVCASLLWYGLCQWTTNGTGKKAAIIEISHFLPTWGMLLLWLPNFSLLGVDMPTWFTSVKGAGLELAGPALTSDIGNGKVWLGSTLWVPQAWTIGCELWFYILAPLVLTRAAWLRIVGAGAVSAALMLFCSHYFLYGGYFVWVFWFWLFALGMMAFLVYEKVEKNLGEFFQKMPASGLGFAVFCWVAFTVPFLAGWQVPCWLLISSALVVVPLLFGATKTNKVDRLLGEFSYPVYCTHMLAADFNQTLIGALKWDWSYLAVFNLQTTLIFSGFCVFAIEQPFERIRANISNRMKNSVNTKQ
jgi:peptidoglycan/LPS O-acetylase OafA/YrhL